MPFPPNPTPGQTHTEENTTWVYAGPVNGWYRQVVNPSNSTTYTGSTGYTIYIPNGTASAPSLAFADDIDTGIYTTGANQLAISTNGTERIRFWNDGDVLINTTSKIASANAALHIYKSGGSTLITQQAVSNSDTISVWNSAASGDNLFTVFYTDNSITLRGGIDYNRAAGQVRYNVTSDQRLKDEIQAASSALTSLNAIQVRSYKWKETGYEVQYGFVAQELHAVYPDAVKEGDNEEKISDVWAVDNGKLVPLLTKALQEAMERIETLEEKVAAITGV